MAASSWGGIESIWNILSQAFLQKKAVSRIEAELSACLSSSLIYGACQLNEKGRNYSHISGQCRSGAFLRELARVKNDAVRALWAAAAQALHLFWRTNERGIVNNQPLCERPLETVQKHTSTTPHSPNHSFCNKTFFPHQVCCQATCSTRLSTGTGIRTTPLLDP